MVKEKTKRKTAEQSGVREGSPMDWVGFMVEKNF